MNIGICGPVNPSELREFLYEPFSAPNINKGASAVNTYVKELLRNNHKVYVFTSYAPPTRTKENIILKGCNIEIHIINSAPGLYLSTALSRIYLVRRIKLYLESYIHELDLLHAQWTYEYALASKAFQSILPVFCTVRDWCPYIITTQKGAKKIQWYLYSLLFKSVMSAEKICFIANSPYTRSQILSKYPNKNIPIIPNPIDKNLILEGKKENSNKHVFISISSSESDKRKNIQCLLYAFKRYKSIHSEAVLKLIGGGFTLKSQVCQQWKQDNLLDGVILMGYMGHDKLIQELDESYCLVHPSLEETFGNILIEAMARGVLTIGGADSGAVPQVLDNGEYGILCDVNSSESICNAMEKSLNEELYKKLTEQAYHNLVNKYSSEAVVREHLLLYLGKTEK